MNKNLESLKYGAVILFTVEIAIAVILEFVFKMRSASVILIFVVIDAIYTAWIIYEYTTDEVRKKMSIKEIVDSEIDEAVQFGNVGIVTYDSDFMITWMSDLFTNRQINNVGQRLTNWLPEISQLFKEDVDTIEVEYNERIYLVERRDASQSLYFKDITAQKELENKYHSEQAVVGLVNLDNYAETIQYEDEQKIALINANLRQKVVEWFQANGMLARRTRNDRFIVFTTQENYEKAYNDRFNILNEVRKEANNLEVAITLSMAFAYGTSDYTELDNMVNELLELAQNRGGDQVAIRKYGEETQFVGGNTESNEKRSGVRIRVMSQSMRGIMENSDSIFILGHQGMDFDCMGAALGTSLIAQSINKEVYIVANKIEIEEKLAGVIERENDILSQRHQFISEEQALELIKPQSLAIVVDHHTSDLCATPKLLETLKRAIVIDHHRRRKDDNIRASMVYLETSASSTTELLVELMQYQPTKIELVPQEANIMLAGMLVDTNHFRNHSSARTFAAAATLREWGADPQQADNLLKVTFHEFELQNRITASSVRVFDDYIVAPIKTNEIFSRTNLSKAADFLLSIQAVKAAFVIAHIDVDTVAISARSNGEVNVQVIMEAMNGGGHFSAAALQRKDITVEDLTKELIATIKKYQEEEEKENESNSDQ